MAEELKPDLCIIGAGSGGLSLAAGAVQMGASVVLIEGHKMGGDCLNYGCVPSKALLGAGRMVPPLSYADAQAHVRATIEKIEPHDSQDRFEGLGVTVLRDWARFTSPRTVEAGGRTIRARRFVIATGSRPFVPPIDGLEDVPYLTNETIFDLAEMPDHLIIIGGGPIGMEMAQAHRQLGCEVTVIEGAKALGRDDPDMAEIVVQHLRGQGITLHENTSAQAVTRSADGKITVETGQGPITGSHLLIAVGRKVNLAQLDLDTAGVEHTGKGVTVGANLRSVSNRRVYAIGDAAGGLHFTHVAGYHAGVVIRSILLGLPAKARTDHIPWVTYTEPELAHVGMSEADARAKYGGAVEVITQPFAGMDRAIATGQTEGLARVIVHQGRPVGATIAGPQAGELIGIWALAIANSLKISAVANTVLPYPSLGEINKRLAGSYFSPRLFESAMVKRVVRTVQRFLP